MPEARARAAPEEAEDAQAVGQGQRQVPHAPATTAPRPSAAPNGSSRTRAPARSRASRRASSPCATTSRSARSSCAARGQLHGQATRALNFSAVARTLRAGLGSAVLYRFARIAPLALALALVFTAPAFAATNVYLRPGHRRCRRSATCQPIIAGVRGYFRCDSVRAAVDAANANPNAGRGRRRHRLPAGRPATTRSAQPLTLTGRRHDRRTGAAHHDDPWRRHARACSPSRRASTANLYRIAIAGGNAGPGRRRQHPQPGRPVPPQRARHGRHRAPRRRHRERRARARCWWSTRSSTTTRRSRSASAAASTTRATSYDQQLDDRVQSGQRRARRPAAASRRRRPPILFAVTIARNTSQPTARRGSSGARARRQPLRVADRGQHRRRPALANCGGPGSVDRRRQTNVEDGCSCEFEITGQPGPEHRAGQRAAATPTCSRSRRRGVAKDLVTPCFGGNDQRNAPRDPSGVCDAGAFEEGVDAPAIDSSEFPEPTVAAPVTHAARVPTPPPMATAAEPTPVVNKTVVAKEVRGRVRIRSPGSEPVRRTRRGAGHPGRLDRRHQAGHRRADLDPEGRRGAGEGAVPRRHLPAHPDARDHRPQAHRGALRARSAAAKAPPRSPRRRKLWGKGSGKFRTTGNYSAATVRGTEWLVQDTLHRHADARHAGRRLRPRQGQEEDDPRARAARTLHGQAAQVTRRPLCSRRSRSPGCSRRRPRTRRRSP